MTTWQPLTQRWRKLSITIKFILAFSMLLLIIVLMALTGFLALRAVRLQTETSIAISVEIQRLVVDMDGHLQQARRLEKEFFLWWLTKGFEPMRQTYTRKHNQRMAQVVKISAALQDLVEDSGLSASFHNSETALTTYQALTKLYGDSFNEAANLVIQLAEPETGVLARLDSASATLHETLQTIDDPQTLALYHQIKAFEKEYLLTRQRPKMQSAFNVRLALQTAINDSPAFNETQQNQVLAQFEAYETVARELLAVDSQIQTLRNGFDLQATAVNPISDQLIVQANEQVRQARDQIAWTYRLVSALLAVAVVVAILLTVIIAILLNKSITRNILKLTDAAVMLEQGHLDVQTQIKSEDELGRLASTFNTMSARINELVTELESEALTAQTQLMEAIESISEGFSLYDADDRLLLVNSKYRQMRHSIAHLMVPGVLFEELLRAGVKQGMYPDALGLEEEWLEERLTQHRHPKGSFEQTLSNGRWLQISEYKTQDGGIVALRVDITDRKQTEAALLQSEEKFSALFRHSTDSLFIHDMDGNILDVNQRSLDLFGYQRAELMASKIVDMHPPEALKLTAPAHKSLLENGYVNFEVDFRKKNGQVFPAEVSSSVIEIGGQSVVQGVIRDITERKQVQETLKRAKEAAETANLAKSQFLANMSHELRTPLNAIMGYSEMLQEEAADMELDEFIPDLNKIQTAGKHLLALISDVLDLSKIEAGRVDLYLETFNVRGMIDDIAVTIQPLILQNNNTLEINCAPNLAEMYADLTKTRQILFNLLSNAAKFTKDGPIELTVTRKLELGSQREQIIFQVTDTGIGINPAQINNLFDAFTQVDASTTRKYGGTGLGLAISQRFSQIMGGGITVQSKVGHGSTFTIRLPAEVPKPEASLETATPNLSATPANELSISSNGINTVLVIDDDPTIQELISRYLNKAGFQVKTASDGETGLQLAKKMHPIAITLDIMMPGMDGWTVLTKLKSDPELADIPVIILTMVSDKNKGYKLGAVDYLTKPIDRNRLITVLDKYRLDVSSCPVLLVEDDPMVRDVVSRTLQREGWLVTEAENGRVALECVANSPPDLILLDLMMPEMNGFQFIDKLHQNPAWQSIPVIVVTAMDLSPQERTALESSVKGVLQKGGYSRDELLHEVCRLVAEACS